MYKSFEQLRVYNEILGRGFDAQGIPCSFSEREFFEISEEMGWNQNNPDYKNLFDALATYIMGLPNIKSSVELGCGPGYLLYCLNKSGIEALGVDANTYSKRMFDQQFPDFSSKYRIDPTFSTGYKKVDLFISIECLEHIADELLHQIMKKVRDELQPKFILFSSTSAPDPNPGWDIQWGHINLKQPQEWEAFFARYGYVLTEEKPPVTAWAALYKKVPG
jgi:2-polyprenyl-3-methyl-5-hydroxy-6-metoxy-1,4-benzoquinol methylase